MCYSKTTFEGRFAIVSNQEHIDVMLAWRIIAQQHGLKPQEVAMLAANFLGLSVAQCNITEAGDAELLELARGIAATACWSRRRVRAGEARGRTT